MAGQITAIKPQQKKRPRVNIYLDGEYAFSLAVMVAAGLKKGDFLTDADIEALLAQDACHQAHEQALHFLSYRPRSVAEIRRYLAGQGVPPSVSEQVVERLSAVGLLDDLAFARYWLENRETFRPRGRQALQYELRQKGLDAATIAQVLEELDEEDSAYRAAVTQARKYARLEPPLFRRKLGAFLQRRGFGYEVVATVVERVWQEMNPSSPLENSEAPSPS